MYTYEVQTLNILTKKMTTHPTWEHKKIYNYEDGVALLYPFTKPGHPSIMWITDSEGTKFPGYIGGYETDTRLLALHVGGEWGAPRSRH